MSVQIQATFRKGNQIYNGLEAAILQLLDSPLENLTCVVKARVSRITRDMTSGGKETPTVQIFHIELMRSDVEEKTATKLLEDSYHARVGPTRPLPQGTLFDHDPDGDDSDDGGDGDDE